MLTLNLLLSEYAPDNWIKFIPGLAAIPFQVYAELNQTCSNYLFWPDGWDGVYELEFGNGKESS